MEVAQQTIATVLLDDNKFLDPPMRPYHRLNGPRGLDGPRWLIKLITDANDWCSDGW
jgi:hypothetical protein